MPGFTSGLWLPNYANDVVRGSARAAISIEVESDYSAAVSGATWDLHSLFTGINIEHGSQGGGGSALDVQLSHGPLITLDNVAQSSNLLTRSVKFTTVRDALEMDEFLDTVKGKKYLLAVLRSVKGTTKRVFFGYGYFDLASTQSHEYGSVNSMEITFQVKAHGLASGITIPALPVNTDAAFGTDDMSKEYIGWLLGSADATKGGFGTAVSLPTTSELHASKVGITLEF